MTNLSGMLLSLGPVPSEDVDGWVRFARRVMCEIRMDPEDLTGIASPELLDGWSSLISQWESGRSARDQPEYFRWTGEMTGENAEYLLNGLDRCLNSKLIRHRVTNEDLRHHAPITMHIVQGFVDGLVAEGPEHEHYVAQVRDTFGVTLDH